ncbi:MAG: hypothetical protein AAGF90_09265 [Pseudomonadota bacterium]
MSLYFRARGGGATAFRVEEGERLTLTPVADVVARTGAVKLRAGALTAEEEAEIAAWAEARRARDEAEAAATPRRAIEAMNEAAHWISGKPGPQAAEAAEEMLMAIHDLRGAIVRHLAKRAEGAEAD